MKKKLFSAFIVFLVILGFCGCSVKQKAFDYETFDSPFELTADFTHGALGGSFVFSRTSPEHCTLKFISPTSVSSMQLTDDSGVVKIDFLGISHETTRVSLKSANPLVALCKAIDDFKTEQPTGTTKQNGDVEYTLSNGTILVAFGNYLKQIQIPTEELLINITAFDYLS